MTFDDDHMVFNMLTGSPNVVYLKAQKLSWPPPLLVTYLGFPFRRIGLSAISDEQRNVTQGLVRSAEYSGLEGLNER